MDILTKIRKLQGERNWTDYKLASEAELSVATLSSLFARKANPKLETLQAICKAFGLTLAQFFLEDETVEALTEAEREMLHRFRRLSASQQRALITLFP